MSATARQSLLDSTTKNKSQLTDRQFQENLDLLFEAIDSVDNLCLTCNKVAMDYLGQNNFSYCHQLLKKAEKILTDDTSNISDEQRSKLLSLTLNNLGCFYKKKEKPNVALFYLKSALEIEKSDYNTDDLNLAGTYLNLCAIYSKLNKHLYAIFNARQAIKLIEKLIKSRNLTEQPKTNYPLESKIQGLNNQQSPKNKTQPVKNLKLGAQAQETDHIVNIQTGKDGISNVKNHSMQFELPQQEKVEPEAAKTNIFLTLAIAHYNLGASLEHMINLNEAINSYQNALQVSIQHLGEEHALTKTIYQNMQKAEDKLKHSQNTHIWREHIRRENATSKLFSTNVQKIIKKVQQQNQIESGKRHMLPTKKVIMTHDGKIKSVQTQREMKKAIKRDQSQSMYQDNQTEMSQFKGSTQFNMTHSTMGKYYSVDRKHSVPYQRQPHNDDLISVEEQHPSILAIGRQTEIGTRFQSQQRAQTNNQSTRGYKQHLDRLGATTELSHQDRRDGMGYKYKPMTSQTAKRKHKRRNINITYHQLPDTQKESQTLEEFKNHSALNQTCYTATTKTRGKTPSEGKWLNVQHNREGRPDLTASGYISHSPIASQQTKYYRPEESSLSRMTNRVHKLEGLVKEKLSSSPTDKTDLI